jgi:hypothetical protein
MRLLEGGCSRASMNLRIGLETASWREKAAPTAAGQC